MTTAVMTAHPTWYTVQSSSTARGHLNTNLTGPLESDFSLHPCFWVNDAQTTFPFARTEQQAGLSGGMEFFSFMFAYSDIPALITAWKAANLTPGQVARVTGVFLSGVYGAYSHTPLTPSWATPDVVVGQGSGPLVDYSTIPAYHSGVLAGTGPPTLGPAPGSWDLTANVTDIGGTLAPQSGQDLSPLVLPGYLGILPLSAVLSPQLFIVTDRASLGGFPMTTDPTSLLVELWYLDHGPPTLDVHFDVTPFAPPMFAVQRSGGLDSHAYRAVQRTTRQSSLLQSGML